MILVTGPRGFVGRRIMERFPDAAALPSELSRSADTEGIAAHVEQVHPSAIFHTAAISDIGTCEKDPQASYQANVLLPVALGLEDRAEALLSGIEQQRRNLWMDCARIRQHGICFDTTAEGFARCVADYGLRL